MPSYKEKAIERIKFYKVLAIERGGECISGEYITSKTKLKWRCKNGHEWEAVPDSIKQGTWCPYCANRIKRTIADLKLVANEKGGDCLSKEYIGDKAKHHWRCSEGHEWFAAANHVLNEGVWCPVCSAGNNERICRNVFEQMFCKPFPKIKPSWLLNDRGNRMELDGYNESLKLAFEYHGIQHYKKVNFFHPTDEVLDLRKSDDDVKRGLCKKNGVLLIEVPYSVATQELPFFVYEQSSSLGVDAKKMPQDIHVASYVLPEKIRAMQKLAEKRGGKCLSSFYVNNNTKLHWECAKGHTWSAVPGSIQQGQWCPRCVYGHEWQATIYSLRKGTWCSKCANKSRGPKRLGLNVAKEVAALMGGMCLSAEYVNTDTKLRWRCADGHEWEAIPDSVVRRKTWCPVCRGKRSWDTRRKNLSVNKTA